MEGHKAVSKCTASGIISYESSTSTDTLKLQHHSSSCPHLSQSESYCRDRQLYECVFVCACMLTELQLLPVLYKVISCLVILFYFICITYLVKKMENVIQICYHSLHLPRKVVICTLLQSITCTLFFYLCWTCKAVFNMGVYT